MELKVVGQRDTRIFSSDFGKRQYMDFLRWAASNGQAKSMFLRNLAVDRVYDPSNKASADTGCTWLANHYGLTEEEFNDFLLRADSNGVSVPEFLNRLENGLRGDDLVKRSPRGRSKKNDDDTDSDLPFNGTEG